MGLLANLLPGIRDLRVPLAAGTVWLAAAVTAFSVWVVPPFDPSSLLGQIFSLGRWAGPAGSAAGLAFMAYVTGIVLEKLRLSPLHLITQGPLQGLPMATYVRESLEVARRNGVDAFRVLNEVPSLLGAERERYSAGQREEYAMEAQAEDGREAGSLQSYIDADIWEWLAADEQVNFVVQEMHANRSQAEFSFLMSSPQVYDLYDRKRAEADFRQAMALPVLFLAAALVLRVVPEVGWWGSLLALLAFPAVLLGRSGALLKIEADKLLEEAIRSGHVPASEPQRIRALGQP